MKRLFIITILFLFPLTVYCQDIKHLKPKIGPTPDLSPKRQLKFERRDALLNKSQSERGLTEAEKKELDRLLEEAPETHENVWDTIGLGCSWYCAGGPYKVRASSELKPSGEENYKAQNAHDFSYKTAWVEGAKGYGKGEYLEYFFKNDSPRITDIIVHNGYIKDESTWRNNSRVKKLKMYINDKPWAILDLKDTRAEQRFVVEPLGRRKDGKDLVLKFAIMDVYKGKKYDDVAITEIYFDGLDVH